VEVRRRIWRLLPPSEQVWSDIQVRFRYLKRDAERRTRSGNGETVMLYEKMKDFTVAGGDVSGLRADRFAVSRQ